MKGRSRARRVIVRLLRWILGLLLVLLLVVGIVALLLLYSAGALKLALDAGLGFYNDRIPGHIQIGRVEGRLIDRLVLGDLFVADRSGRALVVARELTLTWEPWALMHGELKVAALELRDVQLTLLPDGFGDLAIPGPPEPPRETLTPELPFDLELAALDIHNLNVIGEDGEAVVTDLRLALRDLLWAGLEARLTLVDAAALLPGLTDQPRALEALTLEARWSEPRLELRGLITTDLATAELVHVELDAATLDGRALIALDGRRGALAGLLDGQVADYLRQAPADPALRLDARTVGDKLELGLHLELPGLAELDLAGAGMLRGPPELALRGFARAELGPPLGELRPTFAATVEGPDWSRLRATFGLTCGACGPLSGLDLKAEGEHDATLSASAAELELRGAGVTLSAAAEAGPQGLTQARWDLRVPQLAAPAELGRVFIVLPPVTGGLTSRGACTGEPLRCEGALALDRFAGFGVAVGELRIGLEAEPLAQIPRGRAELSARRLNVPGDFYFAGAELVLGLGPSQTQRPAVLEASLDAELWVRQRGRGDRVQLRARVRPGPPLAIDLEALDLQLRGLRARLPRPARVELVDQRVEVDGLALLVAGGQIAVDGHADLGGRSDLRVAIERVQLAPLVTLVPALRGQLHGTLGATATLQGLAQRPSLALTLGVRRLRYRGDLLGELELGVAVGAGRGRATLDLHSRLAARLHAEAELPLALDLASGEVGVKHGPIHLALDMKDIRLPELEPWLGPELAPKGSIDAQIAVDGLAARPTTTIMVRGRDILLGHRDLGSPATFEFTLTQKSGEDAVARLEAGRLAARLRLDAPRLPVRINLVDGGLKWRPERRHTVSLVVRDFDLWRQLGAFMPGNDYYGRIELVGGIDGPMTEPALTLTVFGEGLQVRDAQLGQLRADLQLDHRLARLDLTLKGEVVESATVHAEVPLRVAPVRGDVAWLKDQPHVLTADIRRFDLARLEALGVSARTSGTLDLNAELGGPMHAPQLNLGLDLRDFAWNRRPVGRAHVDLAYRDGRAQLALRSAIGNGTVDGRVSLPIAVDLGRGQFDWDERAQSELELRADGIDRTMLAPLGRVPEEALIELSVRAKAKGNLADFNAGLEAHGQLGHRLIGGAPVHITADIKPKTQALRLRIGPHNWAGNIEVRTDARADILGLTQGQVDTGDIPFTAALRAQKFDLRFIQGFVPRDFYDLNGTLNARLDAKGTLGEPDIDGALHLRNGGITVLDLQQRIRNIELDLQAKGRRIVLDRLTAESGTGRLSATASATVPVGGGLALRSQLDLRKFPLVRPGLPQMQIDSRIRTQVNADADETKVEVQVHATRVWVTGYTIDPPKRIPESANVTFKDQQTLVPVATGNGEVSAVIEVRPAEPAEDAAEEPDAAAAAQRLAIHIRLVDPLQIRGPATEMSWTGAVSSVHDAAQHAVTGELSAKDGRFDLLGNSFRLESGQVTLPKDEDSIDPFVNIVARTSTPVAEVTATFRGRVSRPALTFSSEPAMTQSQILTLLLTGSADASDADEQRVLAQAAALLATFENPALSNFLSSRLGIDRIGLAFGDDVNQPILSVGKRLTKRIYVESAFKFNAPPNRNRVEARVELEITPRWSLETFFGDAAVGGVDLFWHRVFGAPKRLPENPEPAPPKTGEAEPPITDEPPGGAAAGPGGGVR